MPPVLVEKKVRGKKKQKTKKNNLRKVVIFDACYALGRACSQVRDFDDTRRYFKRAKEGYEEQLGRDSEKALEVTLSLIAATVLIKGERIEMYRDLVKRCERALGEENVVTLHTPYQLGIELKDNEEYEEAIKVHESCLAGRMKVLGEDHKDTFGTLNNLGIAYHKLLNYEKALEYYGRALEGKEKTAGKTHPSTLMAVECMTIVYNKMKAYGKAELLYQRALEGYEAQFGKDQKDTMRYAKNYGVCLEASGNSAGMAELRKAHPNVDSYVVKC
ncbi:hypothetical protein TL16_g10214 [Triparma laevis f. inornata]|uniref:Kinesin light chain n=1 Tax=Triparma laevis f. inornata TaxID=1714386 RepID=A0A9W7B751_9STRA|nr:hypothetical protein TL16_g10214 [Triparma laevis f. inornata]